MLISHLDSRPLTSAVTVKASIIDSTGTFPLSTLAEILKVRVGKARLAGKPPILNDTAEERQAETTSVEADVTRCLEMVGISRVFDVEGLWEVLSELSRSSATSQDDLTGGKAGEETQNIYEAEIADSEDEGSEDLLQQDEQDIVTGTDEGVEIIIVDNMTQIINELFSRKEKSDGTSIQPFSLFLSSNLAHHLDIH